MPHRTPRMSDLSDELSDLRHDLSRLADTVMRMVAGDGRSGRSATAERLGYATQDLWSRASDLGRASSETLSQAGRQLSRANAGVERQVVRHPMTAIAVAAGIGMVLGLLSRSR